MLILGLYVICVFKHLPRTSIQWYALPLADGVKPETPMVPYHPPALLFYYTPWPHAQVLLHKLSELDLAQKADSLAVSPSLIRQASSLSQSPDLCLNITPTMLTQHVATGMFTYKTCLCPPEAALKHTCDTPLFRWLDHPAAA